MNKYKIVSLVLALSLFGALARLVFVSHQVADTPQQSKSELVFENILSRKSVRSFTDKMVSREQIDTLLRAAMAAPTGRDMRPWKFIVLDEKDMMDSLAKQLPYAQMLHSAPVAIIVCGDMTIMDKEGRLSENWTFDCSAATENLLLAAEAMGLGAVWTGVHPYEDRLAMMKTTLGLPEHIIPLNVIPIGYPKGNPQPKDKYDENNIHFNGW